MNTSTAVKQLASIAQDARLDIFRLLVQYGETGLPAGQIGEMLNIPASTLSFHLKALSHAELVTTQQSGRFIYYAADYVAMQALVGFLTENCCTQAATSECC